MSETNNFFALDEPTGKESGSAAIEAGADLLKGDEQAVGKRLLIEWEASTKEMKPLLESWKVNRARSLGYIGVQLIKKQDSLQAWFPLGATPSASMNKAGRLKRRVRAVIFADPSKPDAVPSTGGDDDVESAEFATRALEDQCSEGKLDLALTAGDTFDLASDYASGFVRFWTDPKGGGWKPRAIRAHPMAPDEASAMLDPMTGGEADVVTLVSRYVKEDGTLTDNKLDPTVQKMWLPGLRREILSGKHVRLIPSTCEDIWDAEELMIGSMVPISMAKAMFPVMANLSEDELKKLVDGAPNDAKELLPPMKRSRKDMEEHVFVLSRYALSGAKYEQGAYVCAVGNGKIVHRGPWYDTEHGEPMDLPAAQFKQFVDEDNPYGRALMEFLGPGNEDLATLEGWMETQLDRMSNRRWFLPLGSVVTPEQMQSPTATAIYYNPAGKPEIEDVPDIPVAFEKMHERKSLEMDDESGLQQGGQAVNQPSVKSGTHADTIIQQVNQGLSDLRQHSERALTRCYRIMLQHMRRDFTVPQRVLFLGEDGAYKEREWTNADLGSTRDVRLKPGSFTGLTPQAKANVAATYAQSGAISLEEYQEAVASNIGGSVGVQDNPHRLRVRGQISAWRKGPPADWEAVPPTVDPMTGQPVPGQDPVLMQIFDARPVDDDPLVAKLRAFELGRACAGQRYRSLPPEWQAAISQAYTRSRQMAGIQTIEEQQQAAQAQAQQQAQGQQDAEAKSQESEKAKADMEMMKMQTQKEMEMMKMEQRKAEMMPPEPPPIPSRFEAQRDPEDGSVWHIVPVFEGAA